MDCFTIKMKLKICKRLETKGRQERREEGRGEKGRGKEWAERKLRKEDGREGGNGRKKKWEDEKKRCQKERKQSRKETDKQDKGTAKEHNFPAPRPLSPGAWPALTSLRPRRPRPSVVKSPGTLVAAGRVGRPRSLGGCESLGLWPPAQAAPAAGQGGNCPETRRLSGRVVQGCASRTRGGGSHARLRARGLVRLRPRGDLRPPGEPGERRGRPPRPRKNAVRGPRLSPCVVPPP